MECRKNKRGESEVWEGRRDSGGRSENMSSVRRWNFPHLGNHDRPTNRLTDRQKDRATGKLHFQAFQIENMFIERE